MATKTFKLVPRAEYIAARMERRLDDFLGDSYVADFDSVEEIEYYFSEENVTQMWPGEPVPKDLAELCAFAVAEFEKLEKE